MAQKPRFPSGAHLRSTATEPNAPARQQLLKERNLALILRRIASTGRLSRAQIAAETGLTKATVSTLADSLIHAGLIVEQDPQRGFVGRPGSPLTLNPQGPAGLGVEINVDYVSAFVVDLTGSVRHRRTVRGDNRIPQPDVVLERAARITSKVLTQAERSGLAVSGLGVAVPGLVDFEGVLWRAPNLTKWRGIAVASVLSQMLGRTFHSVHCDNEANLAALGEQWFGLRTGLSDFVLVSGDVGVGAGIVVDGKLYRGVRGLGGELGHVTIDPDGPRCNCGGRGCLEAVAGQEALLKATGLPARAWTAIGNPSGPVGALIQRAREGQPETLEALERAGSAIGIALSSFMNLLDLPVAVLGGLYAELAPWLLGPIRAQMRERVVSYNWGPVEVIVSSLKADAAVSGAAGITIQGIIDNPAAYCPQALVGI